VTLGLVIDKVLRGYAMIKDKTLRNCERCECVWRGTIFCPECKEPTGEPINEALYEDYLQLILTLMPEDTRHDN
jgi:hypothetical protein